MIMSFSADVRNHINYDEQFMVVVKELSKNFDQCDLQRAAESLLWILTKDDASKNVSHSTTESGQYRYDIMISYCHKDKDLCFKLYDRLTSDKIRVWLDRDQMFGTPLDSMSYAIENSEFVLISMSDAYKQSGYCKLEANYALEMGCAIIPLVIKPNYRADGWLGLIVTGRMRIDFSKYEFEVAYGKLKVEIDRTRKEKKKGVDLSHHELPSNPNQSDQKIFNEDKPTKQITYQCKKFDTNFDRFFFFFNCNDFVAI
jgi:hypothetical protein